MSASEFDSFWNWFSDFAQRNRDLDELDDFTLGQLFDRVEHVDDRLYCELSVNDDGNQFILTSGGNMELFPLIDELAAAAPEIEGWTVFALKPPLGFEFSIENEGVTVAADELWFLPLRTEMDPDQLGLRVAVPNAEELFATDTADIIWTILETGLGERLTASRIAHLEVAGMPADPATDGYLPLAELSSFIESN